MLIQPTAPGLRRQGPRVRAEASVQAKRDVGGHLLAADPAGTAQAHHGGGGLVVVDQRYGYVVRAQGGVGHEVRP
ncbi:hypothetical protein [Nonomuraea helvata]|uniref:Uncharacterized protein n=1 Tax=Nonomuraea helvata TaxID=37484 RepID=A0ABV5S676_9ACTN